MCLEEAEPEESEEPFIAPPGLAIPPDVELVSINYPIHLLLLIPHFPSCVLGVSQNH